MYETLRHAASDAPPTERKETTGKEKKERKKDGTKHEKKGETKK